MLPYKAKKKDFVDVITSRILRWGDNPGSSRWALSAIIRGTGHRCGEGCMTTEATMSGAATSQGKPAAARTSKRQGTDSPWKLQMEQALPTADLGLMKRILDFWSPEL